MSRLTDQKLSAYIDGELPPEEMSRVAAAVSADPAVAMRLAKLRRADDMLRELSELPEPEADGLRPRTKGPAPRLAAQPRRVMLMAASALLMLAAGAAVGRLTSPGPPVEFNAGGGMLAQAELAEALGRQRSGASQGPIQISMSFRALDGALCRHFVVRTSTEGLACRDQGRWRIEALAEVQDRAVFRTAGAESPVDWIVEQKGVAEILAPEEEARQLRLDR